MKFDLSPVPENAIIDSAFFEIFLFWGSDADRPENILDLFLNSSDWKEDNLMWSTHPDTTGESFGGIPKSSMVETRFLWNVTEGVKQQVSGDNFGFTTIPQNSGSVYSGNAHSSESSAIKKRPKLTIYYHTEAVAISSPGPNGLKNESVKILKLSKKGLTLLAEKEGLYTVRIFNLAGKLIFSKQKMNLSQGFNTLKINGDDIGYGIYLINLKGNDILLNERLSYE